MKRNTVSLKAFLTDETEIEVFDEASSKQAIEEYLYPDTSRPVETLLISVVTHDGKVVDLWISPEKVSVSIEHVAS